jgi:hypothetical protein
MNNLHHSDRFCLALWALSLLLIPFYPLGREPAPQRENPSKLSTKVEGGVAQPADYAMVVLMAVVGATTGLRASRAAVSVIRAFLCFALYVSVINAMWSWWLRDLSLSYNSLLYVFNVLLFMTFLLMYRRCRETLLRVTVHSIAAAVFLQVVLSPFSMNASLFRQALFFNNSNQLGYFAVLAATVLFMGAKHFSMNVGYQAAFYTAAGYLAVLSLSKAAMFAFALLMMLVLLERPTALSIGALLAGTAFASCVYVSLSPAIRIAENLEQRISTSETDETLAARGYDRILNHPRYLLFGAGEGEHGRFNTRHPGELHSSYGTLLFCYGLIGTAIFTYALIVACQRASLMELLALCPAFFYGLTHHGLRFRLFWVLLALLWCATSARRFGKEEQQSSSDGWEEANGPYVAPQVDTNGNGAGRLSTAARARAQWHRSN